MRCIGDPFGPCDCLAPATSFVFCALTNQLPEPTLVAMPCCGDHEMLVGDFAGTYGLPGTDVACFPIEALPALQEHMRSTGDELWLYTHAAA